MELTTMAQSLSQRPQLRRSTAHFCDPNINCCDSSESGYFAGTHKRSLVPRPPLIRRIRGYNNLYFMAWQSATGEQYVELNGELSMIVPPPSKAVEDQSVEMISYNLPDGQAQPGVLEEDSDDEIAQICTASYAVRVVGTPTSMMRSDFTSSPGATSPSKSNDQSLDSQPTPDSRRSSRDSGLGRSIRSFASNIRGRLSIRSLNRSRVAKKEQAKSLPLPRQILERTVNLLAEPSLNMQEGEVNEAAMALSQLEDLCRREGSIATTEPAPSDIRVLSREVDVQNEKLGQESDLLNSQDSHHGHEGPASATV